MTVVTIQSNIIVKLSTARAILQEKPNLLANPIFDPGYMSSLK